MTTLQQQLKYEEGLRLKTYFCPAGFPTIGYGHNLKARPWFNGSAIPDEITADFADALLQSDILKTRKDLEREWPQIMLLSQPRIDACVNMAFQLGVKGFMDFIKLRRALSAGMWQEAHDQALNSAWAQQTPERAHRVAGQLLTGEYYEVPA